MTSFRAEEREYREFLFRKQNGRCAECDKPITNSAVLHHDPPRESPSVRLIDFDGKTKNRLLCRSCHMRTEMPKLIGAQLEKFGYRVETQP